MPVTGRNVTVAVLDTGINSQHVDLAGKVVQNVRLADTQSIPGRVRLSGSGRESHEHGSREWPWNFRQWRDRCKRSELVGKDLPVLLRARGFWG